MGTFLAKKEANFWSNIYPQIGSEIEQRRDDKKLAFLDDDIPAAAYVVKKVDQWGKLDQFISQ